MNNKTATPTDLKNLHELYVYFESKYYDNKISYTDPQDATTARKILENALFSLDKIIKD